ncbi:Rrf2 family transcriptional regulator [Bacillus gobiensis]|uniref:RrF2 family transcriptional regulator n=1 Tax=Bacillus gobiensis TaxID=1441095 RepID=UPI003D1B794C
MRLTNYTDYSLRVLIYLSLQNGEKLSNIKEIADSYHISKNHLMKVTHELGKLGYIETIRGRNGGVKLAKHPREINIGEVVSKTEEDFHLVECFNKETSLCALTPSCKLRLALAEALQAFIDVLKKYTLEDLVHNRDDLRKLLDS